MFVVGDSYTMAAETILEDIPQGEGETSPSTESTTIEATRL